MRHAWLLAAFALTAHAYEPAGAYEITGRIEPPAEHPVFLHGATAPFEATTSSGDDGRFRFRKLPAGTYTLAITTQARGAALQTLEVSPGTVDAKGRLDIVIRIDQGRLESDGARTPGATISTTILSVPDRAMREYQEAQRCLTRSNSDCAIGHLDRAVAIAPRFAAAWNQLGTIAYQAARYTDAETNFHRALDADPDSFEPLVNLGGVLLNLGRPAEALGYNQQAVLRRPNDALANSQLGLTYFDLNDTDHAEKYLKTAIRLDPAHFSHPQLVLAQIYLRRNDHAGAIAALKQFLELHPDSPQAPAIRAKIAALSR